MNRRYFIKLAGSIVLGAACGMQMVRGVFGRPEEVWTQQWTCDPLMTDYIQRKMIPILKDELLFSKFADSVVDDQSGSRMIRWTISE